MKKLLFFLITIFSFVFSYSQFVKATGSIVGNQLVIQVPLWDNGNLQRQALLWLPDDYFKAGNETKRYPMFIFCHGAGEGTSWDITQVTNTSLPQLIAQGLKPYGIDTLGGVADTSKFIVVSVHAANTGWSYTWSHYTHAGWHTIDTLLSRYRVDTTRMFVGGLSAGGSATFDFMFRDTNVAKRFSGFMPLASSPDFTLSSGAVRKNYDTILKRGREMIFLVGNNDGGALNFARIGRDTAAVYAQPNRLFYNEPNAGHDAGTWNPPFTLSWVWYGIGSKKRNSWDVMANTRRVVTITVLTANAGIDQVLTLPVNSTTLSGSASTPSGTTITTYAWTKVSGPNGGSLATPANASTTITGLNTGTYIYRLTVTNSTGAQAADDIQIIVNPVPNQPPVASAGPDQTTTGTSVTLAGSGSDPDGTVASHTWTKVSGPSGTITTPSSYTSTYTSLAVGTHVLRLTVIDNGGLTTTDDVIITVNSGAVTPIIVTKIACSEYRVTYLYSDGSARSNYDIGGPQLFKYDAGVGRTFIDAAMGFNVSVLLDDQHHVWESRVNQIVIDRLLTDTTGADFTCDSVYANFSARFGLKTSDGSVWFWGGNDDNYDFFPSSNGIYRPIKIFPSGAVPGGTQAKKVVPGNRLLILSTTGEIWEWVKGSGVWVKKTTPGSRPAIDIAAGANYPFFAAIIPDASPAPQTEGPVYVWGSDWGFWRGTGALAQSLTQPTSVKTLWNMTANARNVYANQNIIAYIDVNNKVHTVGDNPQGELGNGRELVNRQELYKPRPVYSWTWNKGEFYDGPSQIDVGGKDVKRLYLGNNYTYYVYAQTMDDSTYFWARDKGLVGGFGYGMNQSDIYPNVLDKVLPTRTTPIASGIGIYYTPLPSNVNAGADQSITSSSTTVIAVATPTTLSATGSPGITYTINGYNWRKLTGGPATIASPTSAQTQITGLADGNYTFEIQITDIQTGSRTDTIAIAVNLANNVPPVITTTGNKSITLPTNSVAIGGTVSDADGTIAQVQWVKVSGPSQYTINSPNNASTIVSNLVAGDYVFRIMATDNLGGTTAANVSVHVDPAPAIFTPLNSYIIYWLRYKRV
jgi:predicted esterase